MCRAPAPISIHSLLSMAPRRIVSPALPIPAKTSETQLQTQLSGIQDADEAQSITEFTQAQTELQAALTSRSLLSRKSLFDFLA